MLRTFLAVLVTLLAVNASAPICRADEPSGEISIDSLPPSVVKTVPQCGDDAVDPNLGEISVTFSKEMKVTGHCWSWCYVREDAFPKLDGKTKFLPDKRTCVLQVSLEPDKTYGIWVNLDDYKSFQDKERHPAVPYLLVFKTRSVK